MFSIEAQVAGLPVVAMSTGGSSVCFIEGETAYIFVDDRYPEMAGSMPQGLLACDAFPV